MGGEVRDGGQGEDEREDEREGGRWMHLLGEKNTILCMRV